MRQGDAHASPKACYGKKRSWKTLGSRPTPKRDAQALGGDSVTTASRSASWPVASPAGDQARAMGGRSRRSTTRGNAKLCRRGRIIGGRKVGRSIGRTSIKARLTAWQWQMSDPERSQPCRGTEWPISGAGCALLAWCMGQGVGASVAITVPGYDEFVVATPQGARSRPPSSALINSRLSRDDSVIRMAAV